MKKIAQNVAQMSIATHNFYRGKRKPKNWGFISNVKENLGPGGVA
jgi:hypothetical protein